MNGASSFVRVASLILVLAGMLSTTACVGVTGKSAGASPGGTPAIDVIPPSVNFGGVTIGSADSQTMRVSNTGTAELKITKVLASGAGFRVSGLSIPTILSPGEDATFTVSFKPAVGGNHTGTLSISSNAGESPLVIDMRATGSKTNARLSANATNLDFGMVADETPKSQEIKLTNTGNIDVSISSVSVSGSGFSINGASNATLTPDQSIDVTVNFDPRDKGKVAGNLFVFSNAPTVQVELEGRGNGKGKGRGADRPHSVTLDWAPSTSAVIGYNVYRGSVSGGPYQREHHVPDGTTSFTDHSVSNGMTYFYVVTAIDSKDVESAFSNQVSVTIPSP